MTKRKKRSSLDLHDLSSWRSLIPVLVVKRSKATVWDANASQVTPPFQKKKHFIRLSWQFATINIYSYVEGGTESKVTCRKKTTTTQRTKQVLNMDLCTMSAVHL